jgi:hypothetical protein
VAISIIQLDRTESVTVPENGVLVLDLLRSIEGSAISYSVDSGVITFNEDGFYFVGWFVAPQFGLVTNGSNWGIRTSLSGQVFAGSSHTSNAPVSGFAIINADAGETAQLVNLSDGAIRLSPAIITKASLTACKLVSDGSGVATVNNIGPDIYQNITLGAINIPYDNTESQISPDMLFSNSLNVQEAIDELNRNLKYNAIYTFDATTQSAPPNLPRGYNWHVDIEQPLINEHQYSRYFYLTAADAALDVPGSPNISAAVAHWFIDGRHIGFEYLENGVVHTVVDITSPVDGSVLIPSFRPIPIGQTWFFGQNQAFPFPENDTVRSIIDINVQGLNVMIGNTFNLTTVNKQIVGAINELNSKIGTVQVYEAPDVSSALIYSQNNPNVFVFVAKG